MVQAAVQGIIDFSKAEVYNPQWQRHVRYMLNGLVADNRRKQQLARLQYYTAAMTVNLDDENYEKMQNACINELNAYTDELAPWLAVKADRQLQGEVKDLTSAWEDEHGDLSSAETQAKIRKTVAALRAKRLERRQQQEKAMRVGLSKAKQMEKARKERKNPWQQRGKKYE